MAADLSRRVSFGDLFRSFLKLGAVGFGGPFALLSLLENEIVKRRGWFSPEQYTEAVAIGQMTPGPIFSGAAFYTGYRLRGVAGALVVAVAAHLPGFALAVAAAALYLQFRDLSWVAGASHGIGAGVIGLLLAVALRTGRSLVRDARGMIIAVAALAAVVIAHADPLAGIIVCGVAGAWLYRRPPPRPSPVRPGRESER
ncbi:MAG: chromate transporter [Chloroflexota bacterium]|nr:chromate transporter [Chloroflexota bacterium]